MKNKLAVTLIAFFSFLFFANSSYAVRCPDARPVGYPVFLSAVGGDRSITLNWQGNSEPATYYLLRYGLSKESLDYGNPNIGPKEATYYTVNELQNGVKYYFQMRAGNGCRPGSFSDTISAVAGTQSQTHSGVQSPNNLSLYKEVLGTTSAATNEAKKVAPARSVKKNDESNKTNTCDTYCSAFYFLAVELIALCAFFILSTMYKVIEPGFSLFIPAITIGAYYYFAGKCNQSNFYCLYFIPLSILIYVVMLIAQKYVLIDGGRKNK